MKITYNETKRQQTIKKRGLDFTQCDQLFNAPHISIEDTRKNYGELRFITFGFIDQREIVIVWTPRDNSRRIISMRKANEREQQSFYNTLG